MGEFYWGTKTTEHLATEKVLWTQCCCKTYCSGVTKSEEQYTKENGEESERICKSVSEKIVLYLSSHIIFSELRSFEFLLFALHTFWEQCHLDVIYCLWDTAITLHIQCCLGEKAAVWNACMLLFPTRFKQLLHSWIMMKKWLLPILHKQFLSVFTLLMKISRELIWLTSFHQILTPNYFSFWIISFFFTFYILINCATFK